MGIDLFVHEGKDYLGDVDYYSRFFELEDLRKKTSNALITALNHMYVSFGKLDIVFRMPDTAAWCASVSFYTTCKEQTVLGVLQTLCHGLLLCT